MKVVRDSGNLPRILILNNIRRISSNPVCGGGFADVWKGMKSEEVVALKVLRIYGQDAASKQTRQVRRVSSIGPLSYLQKGFLYGGNDLASIQSQKRHAVLWGEFK